MGLDTSSTSQIGSALRSDGPEDLGLALGQGEVTLLEMASFVGVAINGGRRTSGSPVLIARDAAKQIPVGTLDDGRPVLSPEAAALTRELMRGVVQSGTGGAVRGVNGISGYMGEAIGKTGTTDKEVDLWFVGGTPLYASALWVGYDTPGRVGGSASEVAAPLWGWWMADIHENLDSRPLRGQSLEFRRVCNITGKLVQSGCLGFERRSCLGRPRARCRGLRQGRSERSYVSRWRKPKASGTSSHRLVSAAGVPVALHQVRRRQGSLDWPLALLAYEYARSVNASCEPSHPGGMVVWRLVLGRCRG